MRRANNSLQRAAPSAAADAGVRRTGERKGLGKTRTVGIGTTCGCAQPGRGMQWPALRTPRRELAALRGVGGESNGARPSGRGGLAPTGRRMIVAMPSNPPQQPTAGARSAVVSCGSVRRARRG